jgi:hypothetical protein
MKTTRKNPNWLVEVVFVALVLFVLAAIFWSVSMQKQDVRLSNTVEKQILTVLGTFRAEQMGGENCDYLVVKNLTNSAGIFLLIVKPKSPTENEPPIRCVISTFPIQNGDKVRLVHWQFSKPDAGAADNATMAVPITIRPL